MWAASLAVVSTVAFIIFTITGLPSDARFGPDIRVGWPYWIEILAYNAWLMVVARQAIRVSGQNH